MNKSAEKYLNNVNALIFFYLLLVKSAQNTLKCVWITRFYKIGFNQIIFLTICKAQPKIW